ncbi:MAG: hypothetical protein H6R00_3521 [Proteobacteria bacterium]|nr:hypothetical protein [Pseudomonadota bacterium]
MLEELAAAMALANTPSQRVLEAMAWLRDHFAEPARRPTRRQRGALRKGWVAGPD